MLAGIFSRAKSTVVGVNGGADTAVTAAQLGFAWNLGSRV
jgi:hypothetical protein